MLTKTVDEFITNGYALTQPDKLKTVVRSSLIRLDRYDDKESITALYGAYKKIYGDTGYEFVDDAVKLYYQNEKNIKTL